MLPDSWDPWVLTPLLPSLEELTKEAVVEVEVETLQQPPDQPPDMSWLILSTITARSAQRDPPRTCAWSGGDFNLAGSYACKVEVPPTSSFQVGGDFSSPGMAAC